MPRGIYERTSIKRGKYSRYSQTEKMPLSRLSTTKKTGTASQKHCQLKRQLLSLGIESKNGAIVVKKEERIVRDLVEWLENDPHLTLKQLQERIAEDYFLNICVNTVKNWLEGELISLKNVRCHPGTMNGNNNKRFRSIYVENIMRDRANGRNLVWVDDTNFNLYCRRKKGRSKIGCRAIVIQTASKGDNLHCIGAKTSSRLVKFDSRRASFTSESCKAWMRELINTCTEEGIEKPTIIIDNAPAHSNVETILGPNEDVKITRLAPYASYQSNRATLELLQGFSEKDIT